MELVALLSTGQGTWGQVAGLINNGEWDHIFLIGDDFASKFSFENKNAEFIKVNLSQPLDEMKGELVEKLKGKIKGIEVALSIASGSGKEHMALIAALLNIPVGIKFVALTKDGVIEL